jgi:hypothetical protein
MLLRETTQQDSRRISFFMSLAEYKKYYLPMALVFFLKQ